MHGANTKHARNTKKGTRKKEFGIPPITSRPILPPESQLSRTCTQRHSIYNIVPSGLQTSLSAHPTPLWESSGRANERGSKTSQACYGYPRFNLNLVRLFRFSLPLPVSDAFSSSVTYTTINLRPASHTVLYKTPGSRAAVFQSPVKPISLRSSATQSVHYFSFPPALVFPRSPALST